MSELPTPAPPSSLNELKTWRKNGGNIADLLDGLHLHSDWTFRGHLHLLLGDWLKALASYAQALVLEPASTQALFGSALAHSKLENFHVARELLESLVKACPTLKEAHIKLAQLYWKSKDFHHCLDLLNPAASCLTGSSQIKAMAYQGSCFLGIGDYSNAIRTFEACVEKEPTNSRVLQQLGWALFNQAEPKAALKVAQLAREHARNDPVELADTWYILGRCFFELNQFEECQKALQDAVNLQPNNYSFWASIGVLYAFSKQPKDAFDCFLKALNLKPTCPNLWFNLGILYESCSQNWLAALAFEKSSSLTAGNDFKSKLLCNENERTFQHPTFEFSSKPYNRVSPHVDSVQPSRESASIPLTPSASPSPIHYTRMLHQYQQLAYQSMMMMYSPLFAQYIMSMTQPTNPELEAVQVLEQLGRERDSVHPPRKRKK